MMSHKAYLFEYDRFNMELKPLLEHALLADESRVIIDFIDKNLDALRDPYEGAPLGPEWETLLETRDVQEYGDFALTKYYDPAADCGLGAAWMGLQDWLADDVGLLLSPILGEIVGRREAPFDPGRMGSYFQSPEAVKRNHSYLTRRVESAPLGARRAALDLLEHAMQSGKGLYVTF